METTTYVPNFLAPWELINWNKKQVGDDINAINATLKRKHKGNTLEIQRQYKRNFKDMHRKYKESAK